MHPYLTVFKSITTIYRTSQKIQKVKLITKTIIVLYNLRTHRLSLIQLLAQFYLFFTTTCICLTTTNIYHMTMYACLHWLPVALYLARFPVIDIHFMCRLVKLLRVSRFLHFLVHFCRYNFCHFYAILHTRIHLNAILLAQTHKHIHTQPYGTTKL